MNWKTQTVIVTGGTRGIGKQLTLQLLNAGAKVIATGSSQASVDKAKIVMPGAQWLTLDQSDPRCIEGFVQQVQSKNVSLLINNAGVQQLRSFINPEGALQYDTQKEIDTNLTGPIALTSKLLPSLLKAESAKVVFVTSGLALAPKQSSPVYCATKAALRFFVKSLRGQVKLNGSSISVIEALPPLVDTDMTKGRGKKKMSAQSAAKEILSGIEKDKKEIYVGASKILKIIMRISPSLGEAIMIKM